MISLHRSMHSSQMYTPGPAMSFLTCFWLFPQNEHFSRSPPSPMRAMVLRSYFLFAVGLVGLLVASVLFPTLPVMFRRGATDRAESRRWYSCVAEHIA